MSDIITQQFLEEALGEEIESFEVNSGSNLGDGYTSILFTIDIVMKKDLEKRPVLLKIYPTHPLRQEMLSKMNLFEKELRVYDTLIPKFKNFQKDWVSKEDEVELPFPKFYYGRAVDYSKQEFKLCEDPFENCVMMEDLRKTRGFRLADRLKGFDWDHSELVIVAQAKLHAISWVYKAKSNISSLTEVLSVLAKGHFEGFAPDMLNAMYDGSLSMFQKSINTVLKDEEEERDTLLESVNNARKMAVPILDMYMGNLDKPGLAKSTVNKDNVLRIPGEVNEDEGWWGVALHVDSRLDNMMFRYDDQGKPVEVILVDLQTIKEGDPITDISNSMFTSTNPAPWIKHADQLLLLYLKTFLDICKKFDVAPPKDFNLAELKRRFHRGKIYGFLMALMCFPILLNDPKNAVDFDKMDKDIAGEKLMNEMSKLLSGVEGNSRFDQLVVEIVRKLYAQGVL